MSRVILQVPMDKELKASAEAAAKEQGFSSLQEIVRVMLKKVAKREFSVTLKDEPVVILSKKAEKRYAKMIDDIKHNRNVYEAKDADDFMRQLES